MSDKFSSHTVALDSPIVSGAEIIANDVTPLSSSTRALYVGGAGDLRIRLVSGDEITLRGVGSGIIYPLRAIQVFATGTTATNLVGLS